MTAPIDWSDPCVAVVALRNAYYGMLSGSRAETVEFVAGNGTTQRVTFARTDINLLRSELERAKAECETKQAGKSKRFAAIGGTTPPWRRPFSV